MTAASLLFVALVGGIVGTSWGLVEATKATKEANDATKFAQQARIAADTAADTATSARNAAQQSADRFECHSWARSQTGFDPTQPGGAVPGNQTGASRDQYQRAITACLEARGYSVK